jgi:hypothetical protein
LTTPQRYEWPKDQLALLARFRLDELADAENGQTEPTGSIDENGIEVDALGVLNVAPHMGVGILKLD